MKKTTFLKSLLVAFICLFGGNAVWAQTTTLLEYGTTTAPWTADGLAEWTAGGNPTIKDGYVEITGGNGSYATSQTIAPEKNAIINVTAVWRGRSNTGRDFSKGNGSYFRFGNIIVAQNDQDKKHGYGFAGLDNISSVTTFTAGSYRVDITSCTWLLIEMEITTKNNTVTSFTIKSEDGATTYASAKDIVLANADYTTVAFGYRKSGSVSYVNAEHLKSVKITQTHQDVETANYTVKYVCNGIEVKEAAVRTGEVDASIALTAADTENFYANDKKYIYVSSDVEGKTVKDDNSTVVTVTFREAEKYAWTASSVGTYTTSGETFEGDKAYVKYPYYQLNEGKLWKKDAIDKVFAQSFDITENNQQLTLDYTETEIADVVFLAEVEDIPDMGIVNSGNAEARSSQRAAGYSKSGNTLVTNLPQGKYKMTARFYSPTSAGGTYKFYTGYREIWATTTGNSNATDADTEVVLANSDNEILLGQTGYTAAVDFIYIQSLGTPTAEELAAAQEADYNANHRTVTITDAGYATYCSDIAVDFTSVTGLTAYIATVSGEKVSFTEITRIPVETGVLLKGAAKDYDVAAANTTDDVSENKFVGVLEKTVVGSGAFVLYKDDTHPIGFYKTNNDNFEVGAHTAYLPASIATSRAFIAIDNTASGISEVNTTQNTGAIYNLNGVRVEKATKGLYIINGKKVLK